MKSTQTDATWVSNVYTQGGGENDWKDHQIELKNTLQSVPYDSDYVYLQEGRLPAGIKGIGASFTPEAVVYGDFTGGNVSYDGTPSSSLNTLSSNANVAPYCIAISADGTKVYVTNASTDTVYQYSTSVPFDFTGTNISYDGTPSSSLNTLSGGLNADVSGIAVSADGTKLYIMDNFDDSLYQYSTSVAWDFTGANVSYDGTPTTTLKALTSNLFDSSRGFAVSLDGTKLYAVDTVDDTIYQFSTSVAWDFTGANVSYEGISSNLSTLSGALNADPSDIAVSASGTRVYIVDIDDNVYQYSSSVAWDFRDANLSYEGTSDLGALTGGQGAAIVALAISADNSKMYVIDNTDDTLYQFSTSTVITQSRIPGINTKTVTYEGTPTSSLGTLSGGLNINPTGLTTSADGTKLYVVDTVDDTVYQYSTSVPFDFTGANVSYDGTPTSSLGTLSGGINIDPSGLATSADGTKLYVSDSADDAVYQYSTSVAWDFTGANVSYDGVTFFSSLTGGANGSVSDIAVSADGTKMYVLDTTDWDIYQYSASTAWNFTTSVTYDGVSTTSLNSLSGSLNTSLQGFVVSSDGTQIYVLDNIDNTIYQYSSSVPWDFTGTNLSYVGTPSSSLNTLSGGSITSATGLAISADGTQIYVADTNADTVYQFSTSTGIDTKEYFYYDATTKDVPAGITNVLYDPLPSVFSLTAGSQTALNLVSSSAPNLGGIDPVLDFDNSVDAVFAVNDVITGTERVSDGWDGTGTVSYDGAPSAFSTLTGGANGNVGRMAISIDGKKLYVTDTTDETIYQYSLASPWNITAGLSYDGTPSSSLATISGNLISDLSAVAVSADGTKMYAMDLLDDTIYQFSTSSAFDFTGSNVSYDGTPSTSLVALNGSLNSNGGITLSADGTKLYVTDWGVDQIFQYSTNIAWDFTSSATVVYDGTLSTSLATLTSSLLSAPQGVQFNLTGTKMIVLDTTDDTVYQFSLSNAWDITGTSVSYDGTITSSFPTINAANSVAADILVSNDFTKIYVLDTTDVAVYQYSTTFTDTANQSSQITGISVSGGRTTFEITPKKYFTNITLTDRSVSRDFTGESITGTEITKTTDVITGPNARYLQVKAIGDTDTEMTSLKINLWTV